MSVSFNTQAVQLSQMIAIKDEDTLKGANYNSTTSTASSTSSSNELDNVLQQEREFFELNLKLCSNAMCFYFIYEGVPYQLNVAIDKNNEPIYWIDPRNSRQEPLSKNKQHVYAAALGVSTIVSNTFTGQGVVTKALAAIAGSAIAQSASCITTAPAVLVSSVTSLGLWKFDQWFNTEIMPEYLPGLTLGTSVVALALTAILVKKAAKNLCSGKLGGTCPSPEGIEKYCESRNTSEQYSEQKIRLNPVGVDSIFNSKTVDVVLSRHPITDEFSISLLVDDVHVAKQDIIAAEDKDEDEDEDEDEKKVKKEKKASSQNDIEAQKTTATHAELTTENDIEVEGTSTSSADSEIFERVDEISKKELKKLKKKAKKKKKKEAPSLTKKIGVMGVLGGAVAASEYLTGQGITTSSIVGLEAMHVKLLMRQQPYINTIVYLTLSAAALAAPRYIFNASWLNLEVIPIVAFLSQTQKLFKDRVSSKPPKNPYLVQMPELWRKLFWYCFGILPEKPPELPLNSEMIEQLDKRPGSIQVTLPNKEHTEANLKVVSGMPKLCLQKEKKVKEKSKSRTCEEALNSKSCEELMSTKKSKEILFVGIMTALTLISAKLTQEEAPTGVELGGTVETQNQGEGVVTSLLFSAVPTCAKKMGQDIPLSVLYSLLPMATALAVVLEIYLAKNDKLPFDFSFIFSAVFVAILLKHLKKWNNGKSYGSKDDPLLEYLASSREKISEFFNCMIPLAETSEQKQHLEKCKSTLLEALGEERK